MGVEEIKRHEGQEQVDTKKTEKVEQKENFSVQEFSDITKGSPLENNEKLFKVCKTLERKFSPKLLSEYINHLVLSQKQQFPPEEPKKVLTPQEQKEEIEIDQWAGALDTHHNEIPLDEPEDTTLEGPKETQTIQQIKRMNEAEIGAYLKFTLPIFEEMKENYLLTEAPITTQEQEKNEKREKAKESKGFWNSFSIILKSPQTSESQKDTLLKQHISQNINLLKTPENKLLYTRVIINPLREGKETFLPDGKNVHIGNMSKEQLYAVQLYAYLNGNTDVLINGKANAQTENVMLAILGSDEYGQKDESVQLPPQAEKYRSNICEGSRKNCHTLGIENPQDTAKQKEDKEKSEERKKDLAQQQEAYGSDKENQKSGEKEEPLPFESFNSIELLDQSPTLKQYMDEKVKNKIDSYICSPGVINNILEKSLTELGVNNKLVKYFNEKGELQVTPELESKEGLLAKLQSLDVQGKFQENLKIFHEELADGERAVYEGTLTTILGSVNDHLKIFAQGKGIDGTQDFEKDFKVKDPKDIHIEGDTLSVEGEFNGNKVVFHYNLDTGEFCVSEPLAIQDQNCSLTDEKQKKLVFQLKPFNQVAKESRDGMNGEKHTLWMGGIEHRYAMMIDKKTLHTNLQEAKPQTMELNKAIVENHLEKTQALGTVLHFAQLEGKQKLSQQENPGLFHMMQLINESCKTPNESRSCRSAFLRLGEMISSYMTKNTEQKGEEMEHAHTGENAPNTSNDQASELTTTETKSEGKYAFLKKLFNPETQRFDRENMQGIGSQDNMTYNWMKLFGVGMHMNSSTFMEGQKIDRNKMEDTLNSIERGEKVPADVEQKYLSIVEKTEEQQKKAELHAMENQILNGAFEEKTTVGQNVYARWGSAIGYVPQPTLA